MARSSPWGLYVHVPWCTRRCPYCAFYVEVARETPWADYARSVEREHLARRADFPSEPASTLFFGGGTPSLLPPPVLRQLIQALQSPPHVGLEANPEDLNATRLAALREAGVTRLSVGVQTFNPDFARLLNRASTVHHAREMAHAVAQTGFDSWSLDLIFALPGQSLSDLDRDLDAVLAVEPPHVSLYGLSYEPGTAFERAKKSGKLKAVPDGLWAEMYERVVSRLQEAGLKRYEVSNFARLGHQSAHNLLYWTDAPYMGLGPSAHGYAPSGKRWANRSSASEYLKNPLVCQSEQPNTTEAAIDFVFSTLRCERGLCLSRLRQRYGATLKPALINTLVNAGLVRLMGQRLQLEHAGFPVADGLTSQIVNALEHSAS